MERKEKQAILFGEPVSAEAPAKASKGGEIPPDKSGRVASWLAQFHSADEVADLARTKKITGKQKAQFCCPLARLLQKEFQANFSVGGYVLLFRNGSLETMAWTIPLPVREFIRGFDVGEFPDLVEAP